MSQQSAGQSAIGSLESYLADPVSSNMRPSLCIACADYSSRQQDSAGGSLLVLPRADLPNEATGLHDGAGVYCRTALVLGMTTHAETCNTTMRHVAHAWKRLPSMKMARHKLVIPRLAKHNTISSCLHALAYSSCSLQIAGHIGESLE